MWCPCRGRAARLHRAAALLQRLHDRLHLRRRHQGGGQIVLGRLYEHLVETHGGHAIHDVVVVAVHELTTRL